MSVPEETTSSSPWCTASSSIPCSPQRSTWLLSTCIRRRQAPIAIRSTSPPKRRASRSARSRATWKTDVGITGYTDNHVHFEVKGTEATIVSLGGPGDRRRASMTAPRPAASNGYSMVTDRNAWHDAMGQHYLLSQTEDISLSTREAGKRAVVQSDHRHRRSERRQASERLRRRRLASAPGSSRSRTCGTGSLGREDAPLHGGGRGQDRHVDRRSVHRAPRRLIANKTRVKFDAGQLTSSRRASGTTCPSG